MSRKVEENKTLILGEFNCSCVGISNFGAGCGPGKDLKDVSDDNYNQARGISKMNYCHVIRRSLDQTRLA